MLRNYLSFYSVFIILGTTFSFVPRKVHLHYPIELLAPVVGSHFEGTVQPDRLTCFSNRDYSPPTYKDTLLCMLSIPGVTCTSVWGSRGVVVDVLPTGAAEFFKVNRLPPESQTEEYLIHLNATRWLELSSDTQNTREIMQIPAEPIFLCVRSNQWTGKHSNVKVNFRVSLSIVAIMR
jgi:hypothetical protein